MSEQLTVVILGSGNIACDLLVKIQRSNFLKCVLFVGRRQDSPGVQFARHLGVKISDRGEQGVIDELVDGADILFDATSADEYQKHFKLLAPYFKKIINLTPAPSEVYCVPSVNDAIIQQAKSISLITCGGQAAIPLASLLQYYADDLSYIETVTSISSKSAGPATRYNIDEYQAITERALSTFSNCRQVKSILVINPAEPPVVMKTAIYALAKSWRLEPLKLAVSQRIVDIQAYLPYYKLTAEPVLEDHRLLILLKVQGRGDYLPSYAGNLDIITSAAVFIAENCLQGMCID